MRRYRRKKEYQWSSDLAYFAGLMASDGCMAKDRRHLNLTSNDIEILNSVKQILELEAIVGRKKNGQGNYGHQIQFGDVALYDFLFDAGIQNNKSKTIGAVLVPDEFYRDFLRGVFDGDGSIWGYRDTRWPNSHMFYSTFTSASMAFLNWLQSNNSRLANVSSGNLLDISKGTRAGALRYAKADSRLLFSFIYYSPSSPRLTRKYLKFIDFLNSDPYTNVVIRASGGMADTLI